MQQQNRRQNTNLMALLVYGVFKVINKHFEYAAELTIKEVIYIKLIVLQIYGWHYHSRNKKNNDICPHF